MAAFRQNLGLYGKAKMHHVIEMKSFGHGDIEEMLKLHLCSGVGKQTLIPPLAIETLRVQNARGG